MTAAAMRLLTGVPSTGSGTASRRRSGVRTGRWDAGHGVSCWSGAARHGGHPCRPRDRGVLPVVGVGGPGPDAVGAHVVAVTVVAHVCEGPPVCAAGALVVVRVVGVRDVGCVGVDGGGHGVLLSG